MSKNITIGNDIYPYPTTGTPSGWGEAATDIIEAIGDKLQTLTGTYDINTTEDQIDDAIDEAGGAESVVGLIFNKLAVSSFICNYNVYRTDGTTPIEESGTINGYYDNGDSAWYINVNSVGNAGIDFVINTDGQIQYYTTTMGGSYAGSIKFRARTFEV